ncbi:hypothetical protein [uncultured Sphingomonas sp.]|uniref:hypothetical protein n=1 Tax=uncultured Sphingomonas sp. TaxID=158754 RepID=UPI0037489950
MADPADPRILDAIALVCGARLDCAIVMDRDHLQPVGRHFDRQQPAERGQRHDLPPRGAHHELARILGIDMFERPGIEPIAAVRPADRMDMPVVDGVAQRLRHADHQQQVTVRQTRQPRIEGAQHIGFGVEVIS